jgi:hypothetical protein
VHRRRPKRRWLRWLLLLAVLDAAVFYWWWSNQAERRYNSIIRDAAAEFGVEYALIKAVIWQESRFREDAMGDAGEIVPTICAALATGSWMIEILLPLLIFVVLMASISIGLWKILSGGIELSGTLRICGESMLSPSGGVEPWQRGISWLGQERGLWPHLSIESQCRLMARDGGKSAEQIVTAARLLGIADLIQRRPGADAGAQRRVPD